jgi:hypothetical protein
VTDALSVWIGDVCERALADIVVTAESARSSSATDVQSLSVIRERNLARMQRRVDIQLLVVNFVIFVGPIQAFFVRRAVRVFLVDVFVRVEGDVGVGDGALGLLRGIAWSRAQRNRVDRSGNCGRRIGQGVRPAFALGILLDDGCDDGRYSLRSRQSLRCWSDRLVRLRFDRILLHLPEPRQPLLPDNPARTRDTSRRHRLLHRLLDDDVLDRADEQFLGLLRLGLRWLRSAGRLVVAHAEDDGRPFGLRRVFGWRGRREVKGDALLLGRWCGRARWRRGS